MQYVHPRGLRDDWPADRALGIFYEKGIPGLHYIWHAVRRGHAYVHGIHEGLQDSAARLDTEIRYIHQMLTSLLPTEEDRKWLFWDTYKKHLLNDGLAGVQIGEAFKRVFAPYLAPATTPGEMTVSTMARWMTVEQYFPCMFEIS
jgi:hypothetical protein